MRRRKWNEEAAFSLVNVLTGGMAAMVRKALGEGLFWGLADQPRKSLMRLRRSGREREPRSRRRRRG